ncbi:MAG: hypothetical protein QOJ09_2867 [Actinomycetota bacterium]|nr:hypothetical protein [Actinomycetota bacterium]
MRFIRRLAAIAMVATVVGALVGVAPASADTPERFVGSAAGRALDISLLRTSLSFGDATGTVNSALDPVASAAGQVLPSLVGATKATTASGTKVDGETCGLPQLPDPLGSALQLGVACSTSTASVLDGLKSTASNGYVASVGLDASSLLSLLPLPDVLGQVPLDQVTGTAKDALAPILGPVADATGLQIDQTVDTLTGVLKDLLKTKALDVTLGKATSSVVTDAAKLTSVGTAEGATIRLLPVSTTLGDIPLAVIKIGSSKATATYDRGLGKAVPSFSAALVTIDLAPALGLPAAVNHIEVAPGQTVKILEGTPLQSTITVADGKTTDLPDGGVKAVADGVSLELLQGLSASSPTAFDGGLAVRLAHSEAQVAGAPATSNPGTQVLGVTALPRTGGTPWVPMAGVGILAVALIGRRASVRSAKG